MTKYIKSIFAGVVIGIGGLSYLSVDNKILGAALFSIGLLLVCFLDFYLYTGKVSYLKFDVKNMKKSGGIIVSMLIGNFIGAASIGILMSFTNPYIYEKAVELCDAKLSEGLFIIPLSILCNFMIFFAVEVFKRQQEGIVKITIIILCVMVFILCGFEHSIANMFYFAAARKYGTEIFIYLLLNILFNGIGGVLIQRLYKQTLQRL